MSISYEALIALRAIEEPLSEQPCIPYSPEEQRYIPISGPWNQCGKDEYQWILESDENPYPGSSAAYVAGSLFTLIEAERFAGGSVCWWDKPGQGKSALIEVSGELRRLNGTVVPLVGSRIEGASNFRQPTLRIDPESMRNPAQLAFRALVSQFDGRFRKLADLFHVEDFDRDIRRSIRKEGGFYRNSNGAMVADLPVAGSEPDPGDPIAAMYDAIRQAEKGREALARPADRIFITYRDGVWTHQDCRLVMICGTSLEDMASWAISLYKD